MDSKPTIEDRLQSCKGLDERLSLIFQYIREAMEEDRSDLAYLDGRYALGWLKAEIGIM